MTAPAFQHRGVMLDLARLTEQHDYYRGLLPHLADWGYNLLHLHLTDDQGCALRFPSHPELATEHAFSVDEMREFCRAAQDLGLEIVPEIECWGHTDFITRLDQYRHLREIEEGPGQFSGMCVFEPDARDLLRDLLRDTVDIFEPRLIHAGLDEVNFGHHPTSKKLLEKQSASDLFADHIIWCHGAIDELGARLAMWGDHVYKDETLLRRTPKDALIFDWHYLRDYVPESLDVLIEHGFEVYGAPAVQFARNRVLSSRENFENLQRFSGHALSRREKDGDQGFVSGMVVTVWCPYRYVPGTIEYPLAMAARLFCSDELPPLDFAETFAAEFWGLPDEMAGRVGWAVEQLYESAPVREEYNRTVWGHSRSGKKGEADTFCRADQDQCRRRLQVVRQARSIIEEARDLAKRNNERLLDLTTAAEFLETIYQYGAEGRRQPPDWKGLHESLQAAWCRSRYTDTPAYSGTCPLPPLGHSEHDEIMRHLNRLAGEA